ncbi:hypothetical protein [Chryseobacterium paludis]|uniref:hypothetical protein n=1 Tax=Chryseobacterium paludis TaxID=2956784 RepID=UPI0021C0BD87|nr:hypothetical protein [Chryseobacterium paludis]
MKKLLVVLFVAIFTTAFSQELKIVSGNFDFLKDQTEVNVELKFDNALYQVENFTEAQYLERRKKEVLAKKTEQDWQKWNEEWEKYKSSEYIQYFFKGINGKSKKVTFKNDVKAKYTLIIDAKWIYAGWHGGIIGQEAKLSSDMKFVETDNPSKIVMELKGDKVLGKPQNKAFVMEYGRIAGAYEATGKVIGKEIKKVIK